jgi:hypothetical protein
MFRSAVRVLFVAGLAGIGWIGHAQTTAERNAALAKPAPPELSRDSDFELQVFTADGKTEVRCVRGCKLTWAPTGRDMLAPDVKVVGVPMDDGCIATGWNGSKNCHILGWKR